MPTRAPSPGPQTVGCGQVVGHGDIAARNAVFAGCRRSVVRKIDAGVAAFVQMEREGILDTLDSQQRPVTP